MNRAEAVLMDISSIYMHRHNLLAFSKMTASLHSIASKMCFLLRKTARYAKVLGSYFTRKPT